MDKHVEPLFSSPKFTDDDAAFSGAFVGKFSAHAIEAAFRNATGVGRLRVFQSPNSLTVRAENQATLDTFHRFIYG